MCLQKSLHPGGKATACEADQVGDCYFEGGCSAGSSCWWTVKYALTSELADQHSVHEVGQVCF